ncbi:DNA adenine methylase [Acutalibacter muris]|jgi:DNA adenine methylase|uniref:DNA adenine methylase n=1 Tax=Acutalibacter muris TaxID=1796620 RepID=UPI0026F3D8F5|nr:DNA adenine methylase [Acutalibacter muris]
MNCVLKYPGAKWGVASWVISFFPPHHSYLEPFFGSGGVFFNKNRSNIETINDLDGEVINLFECIKSDPERLARDIYFTPYARASYDKAFSKEIPKEPFDRAARLLIRCNMGHGFRTTGERVGWKNDVAGRERAYAAKAWTELPDIIVTAAERLRGVQIECSPAVELISRFNAPGVLVYCDPPYVLSTRRGKQYRCEMTDDDHLRLLDVLKRHKGPVLISGYKSPMYDAELRGWHREAVITTDQLSQRKEETIWMNFQPAGQLSLYDAEETET